MEGIINKRSKNNTQIIIFFSKKNYLLEEPNFIRFLVNKGRKKKNGRSERGLCTALSLNICGHNYHKVDYGLFFPQDVLIVLLQKYKVCITELFYP